MAKGADIALVTYTRWPVRRHLYACWWNWRKIISGFSQTSFDQVFIVIFLLWKLSIILVNIDIWFIGGTYISILTLLLLNKSFSPPGRVTTNGSWVWWRATIWRWLPHTLPLLSFPDISLKIYSGRCSTARRSGGRRGIVRLRFAPFYHRQVI